MGPDRYFILIYNVANRELEIHDFEQDYNAAADAYSSIELEHRKDPAMEVVLVGADSIETIHKTHSHYFAQHADDLFQQFLEATPALHPQGAPIKAMRARSARRRRR